MKSIAVVGGTGQLGRALARRWAKAGVPILIGSRDAERARAAAQELSQDLQCTVEGGGNAEMADRAEVVLVTVPAESQVETLTAIRPYVLSKLVIDATVPLAPPKVMRVQLPAEGSAALRAQVALGPDVTLVTAFHSVAAHRLITDQEIDCDVLVFGDSKEARAEVVALAGLANLRGVHGGSLANSAAAEALTSVLIFINRTYAADGAGIRITGIGEPGPPAGGAAS